MAASKTHMRLAVLLLAASAMVYADDSSFTVVSATSPMVGLTSDSLATIYGANLAPQTASATTYPWPTSLGGMPEVTITDSAMNSKQARLAYVSLTQMNIWIPSGLVPGPATVSFPFTVGLPPGAAAALRIEQIMLQKVAPGFFSADGSGTGVAAATAILTLGPPSQPFDVFTCMGSVCTPVQLNVGVDRPVYLSFYGTGFRSASNVTVTIGTLMVQPTYTGAQPGINGLDQLNVPLSLGLRGAGIVNVILTADGVSSNPVQISIQ